MSQPTHVYDVAIIGGGIAGAGIARDASLRGMSVVLFEKETFGSGTSSKSSKLIHGGVRYLEIAWNELKQGRVLGAWKNFRFVFSALRETHVLEFISPELVRPVKLVVPIYTSDDRHPLSIYLGTLLYGFLSLIAGNRKMPRLLWSKKAVLKLLPRLNSRGLVGGVVIWDHVTQDQRLVEATMQSAVKAGAEALEHSLVQRYGYNVQEKLHEIIVRKDLLESSYFARKLINAGGPWVDQIRGSAGDGKENFITPVAGAHITLAPFTECSVILRAEDKRTFFVINTEGRARVGTTERLHAHPDKIKPLDEEVEYLLCALENYFPDLRFTTADVLGKDAGVRPLARPVNATSPHDISREHEVRIGKNGVLHVLGVKLTDHRRAAEEVVNRIVPELQEFNAGISARGITHLKPLA